MASPISKFIIPLKAIQDATNNFDQNNLISAGGGLGPAYKGQLLQSGNYIDIVASRLDRRYGLGTREFLTAVSLLSELDHPNIVPLIGYCDENGENVMITSYVGNGSLSRFINKPNLITWSDRLHICNQVAKALNYLHSHRACIVHRNVNSYTILLDDHMKPVLSGFEIGIKQPRNRMERVVFSEPIGIEGYMDPAVEVMGGVTYKSDIYSFGVVLFELLCGRLAFVDDQLLAPLARGHYENSTLPEIIYPELLDQVTPESLLMYSELAYSCTHEDPRHRPHTYYILDKIEELITQKHQGDSTTFNKSLNFEEASKTQEALTFQLTDVILVNNQHLRIPLADIKAATADFSERYNCTPSKCVISYNLYKVDFHYFDEEKPFIVVIKRLKDSCPDEVFFNDIQILIRFKHPNIVNLVGFCVEGSEKIIILKNFHVCLFDYIADGETRRNLTWERRLKICIDVGQALIYLQSQMEEQKMIIEWKTSSTDIALDENFRAMILNFESFKFVPRNQEDEEALYPDGIVEKVVLGFVKFLLLVLCDCGMSLYMHPKSWGRKYVPDYLELDQDIDEEMLRDMIDPLISEETSENTSMVTKGPDKYSLDTFIGIAFKCVKETGDERPTMNDVITELEKALVFQGNKNKQVISLEDLKLATRNFHDDNYIGGGGFGKVYVGKLQDGDGSNTIVVKRLYDQGKKQFLSELEILWEYKHENVIGLVGYCDENDEKIIVYEYASRSSLYKYLNHASLTWLKRLNICIDIASALDFLHGGGRKQAKVVHRDIKTANILLNHDWKAKLADFGLSLISTIIEETDYVIDDVCGTPGYMDPLYAASKFLTIKSDIYSFGVVLFEILCGKSTFEIYDREGHYLPEFISKVFKEGKHDELVSEQIKGQILPKSLTTFQEISYQCLHHEREKRPTAKEVLKELKKALEYQITGDPGSAATSNL